MLEGNTNLGLGELFEEVARGAEERERPEELERCAASSATKDYSSRLCGTGHVDER